MPTPDLATLVERESPDMTEPKPSEAHTPDERLLRDAWGALNFILAFYEPGQRHLDTNAWKQAEAGGRRVHADLSERLGFTLLDTDRQLLSDAEARAGWEDRAALLKATARTTGQGVERNG